MDCRVNADSSVAVEPIILSGGTGLDSAFTLIAVHHLTFFSGLCEC